MQKLKNIFKPDYENYDGVRRINIYLLRLFFILVVVFVASDSWIQIFTHKGPWDHVKAAAWCMWAAYSLLSIYGILYPLRLLAIAIFDVLYKIVWLFLIAFPLWSSNKLVESPAEEMVYAYLWVVLPVIAVPWKYAIKKYALNRR